MIGKQVKQLGGSHEKFYDDIARRRRHWTARKLIAAAHGRVLGTAAARVVQIEGGASPKSAAIVEWDSLDDAVAFYKSKAWTDLAPQRNKTTTVIRRYVVETEK